MDTWMVWDVFTLEEDRMRSFLRGSLFLENVVQERANVPQIPKKILIHRDYCGYFCSLVGDAQSMITTPNFNPFLKPNPTYSCLKCTSTIHESLGSILEIPIL